MSALVNRVTSAIDEFGRGNLENALMHACIAVDRSAQNFFQKSRSDRNDYKIFLRSYFWIIQAMLGGGIDVKNTRFTNIKTIENITEPDLADIIYHIFRCTHLHGNEISSDYEFTISDGASSTWRFAENRLQIPERLIWGLLATVVFAEINNDFESEGDYYLCFEGEEGIIDKFVISEWWGKEGEFKKVVEKYGFSVFSIKFGD